MKIRSFLSAFLFFIHSLYAECCGKVEAGPALLRIDVIDGGKTVRKLDVEALRIDGSYRFYKALVIKPTILLGKRDALIETFSLGLGACLPWREKFIFTPVIGYSTTCFRSHVDFPQLNLFHLRERFRSNSIFTGIDVTWTFAPKWRIGAAFQYAWARTYTTINPIFKGKSSSSGPNYAAQIERDINDNWSINLGAGYNTSLSHEKQGLRGKGVKLGIVYWF